MRKIKHYLHKIIELYQEKKLFKFIIANILWKTHLCKKIYITKDLYKIRFNPSSISMALWMDPSFRAEDEQFLINYLKPGDIVIDIGANIGTLTLTAAAIIGPTGAVWAVEPHPIIFKYLQDNINLNNFKNIKTFNLALGDQKSEVSFSDKKADDMNQIRNNTIKGIKVKILSLDELAYNEIPHINLLKIDVEGYELFVFKGAKNILEKTECIYFEFSEHNFKRYGYNYQNLANLLQQHNFKIYRITHANLIEPMLDNTPPEVSTNLLALKDPAIYQQRVFNSLHRI